MSIVIDPETLFDLRAQNRVGVPVVRLAKSPVWRVIRRHPWPPRAVDEILVTHDSPNSILQLLCVWVTEGTLDAPGLWIDDIPLSLVLNQDHGMAIVEPLHMEESISGIGELIAQNPRQPVARGKCKVITVEPRIREPPSSIFKLKTVVVCLKSEVPQRAIGFSRVFFAVLMRRVPCEEL